nr:Mll5128 protein [uncultured bacterium]
MDLGRPGGTIRPVTGRWVSDTRWPFDQGETQRWYLNAEGLAREKGRTGKLLHRSVQTVGGDSGEYCVIWLGPEFAGDQRADDAMSLTFDGDALKQHMDLVGAATLTLKFSADKPVANVAVRLNAVWPDGASSRLSYAVFNLCHRDGHDKPQPLKPGKVYTVKIALDDVACRVPKGHSLRVSLSTSYWPLIWPAPEPVTLTVHAGASFIDIPVRKRRAREVAPTFAAPEAARPVRQTEHSKPSNLRELTRDQATGEVRLKIVDDFGRYTIEEHGMQTWACGRENYSIRPDDPLSARQECHWTEERVRGDWNVRTETYSAMTATKTHWHVTGRLEAFENDKLILTRSWDEKVKRRLN